MYLSPRRTLIALRSSRRTTSRSPLDRAAAGAPPAASLTGPPGRSRMAAAGDAGGSIAGLGMLLLLVQFSDGSARNRGTALGLGARRRGFADGDNPAGTSGS